MALTFSAATLDPVPCITTQTATCVGSGGVGAFCPRVTFVVRSAAALIFVWKIRYTVDTNLVHVCLPCKVILSLYFRIGKFFKINKLNQIKMTQNSKVINDFCIITMNAIDKHCVSQQNEIEHVVRIFQRWKVCSLAVTVLNLFLYVFI